MCFKFRNVLNKSQFLHGTKRFRGFPETFFGEPLHILKFHTAELRNTFKENFEDLILEASELLV